MTGYPIYAFLQALEKVNSGETNPGPSNATTAVVITIIDIDDNLPTFAKSLYNASVFENFKQVPLTMNSDGINVSDVDQVYFAFVFSCYISERA